MDYVFEKKWDALLKKLEVKFDMPLDLQAVLFLIGVQELGQGFKKFSKDEKVQLMHVAICTLLQHYEFYRLIGRDKDGWPHFEQTSKLPHLDSSQQELLVKKSILEYFREMMD